MFPKIVATINITPDSFSDGGQFFDAEKAVCRAQQALEQGADIVEFGAESSRPGALPVSLEEERARLLPVVRETAKKLDPTYISIDTRKPELMVDCARLGVGYINNIEGLTDQDTLKKLVHFDHLSYIAMHMHRSPKDMQKFPMDSKNDCERVMMELYRYSEVLRSIGFNQDRIFVDPGIGFGKSDLVNLNLLHSVPKLAKKLRVMVGVSRKSMIGRLFGVESLSERDPVSKALELSLMMSGAHLIRTHQVAKLPQMRQLLFGEPHY